MIYRILSKYLIIKYSPETNQSILFYGKNSVRSERAGALLEDLLLVRVGCRL
jgi:hypothetical protein